MFAKIIGAIMLVLGVGLAFSTLKSVLVGTVALIGVAAAVALAVGLLYVAWRLINGQSVLGKILGAFLLVGGVIAGFHAAGAVVVGTIGAIILTTKVVFTAALIYFGWRWLKTGEFSAPSRSELRGVRF